MNIRRPKSNQPIPSFAKIVFKGVVFDTYQWKQKLYDGSYAVFEKVKRPDSIVVFPVLNNGQILLIKEKQPGEKEFIGAVSGRIEHNEIPLDTARRELLEETGYQASEYTLWDIQQPLSKVEWTIYTFIAKGLVKKEEPVVDPGERITPHPVDFDEFLMLSLRKNLEEKHIKDIIYEARLDLKKMKVLKGKFTP